MDVLSENQNVGSSTARRTGNYKPNIWNYDHLQSLISTKYDEENKHYRGGEAEKLKEEVLAVLGALEDPINKLELIDDMNKLALSYYFEEETTKAMIEITAICENRKISSTTKHDLYSAALYFRVLRQHGYNVSQGNKDAFLQLLEEEGSDYKAGVEIFEASHLAIEGECLFDKRTKSFDVYAHNKCPSHWSVNWFDAKKHIHAQSKYFALSRLAGLSFNAIQAQHQSDLKEVLRWWRNLGLSEVLTFSRDRAVESFEITPSAKNTLSPKSTFTSFLWAVGVAYEPQHKSLRKWLAKAIILVLVIDDVYDIYGTEHELEQFTTAVDRWDPKEIQTLSEAIKRCFMALYDTANEMDLEIQNEKGWESVLPHLKKGWTGFCKALLVEAKWYHNEQSPSLRDYLDNGWTSSSGPLLSLHTLLGVGQDIAHTIAAFDSNQGLVRCASTIFRLCNDQGTSKAELERGDAPSSILCHMREANVEESESRIHIRKLTIESWKKMNGLFIECPQSQQSMMRYVVNVARVANFVYQNGDGCGVQDRETKNQVLSCLIEPLQTPVVKPLSF